MQTYKDHGDDWVRPQHRSHVRGFFLQHKKLASKLIRKEAEKISLKSAIAKIHDMKEKDKNLYFDESSFNTYGYELMRTGKMEDAIMIFKLNVKIFPESANVYDSLGEAYMKNGQKELAIINYKKSLKLNTENTNAAEMLKELKNR